MIRLALAVLLALAWPAQAPAPLPVRAELSRHTLIVTWQPPPGQALACVERSNGLLLTCALGGVGRLTLGPGSLQEGRRLTPGDGVRLRVWGVSGAELGRGEAVVFGAVRYFPMILHGRLR